MTRYRSCCFRIHPTTEQTVRLRRWEDALRTLWNIAHEQRLLFVQRREKQPGAFYQIRQLPELRSDNTIFSDVPSGACGQILIDLDMAWQRYATKISDRPNWKKKKINKSVSIYGKGTRPFKIVKDGLILAKIGYIKAVLHRTAVGRIKSYRIFRDVNQWFVSILCEQEVPDPPKKHEPVIGIDRGITNLVADSNGSVVPNPKHWEKMHKKLARVQRVASRRKRGSKRCDKAKERVAKIHRKIRRQRAHILHQLSAWYAKTFGVVVVEDLNVAGMSKGKLARQINNAGWSALITMIRYKIEAVGGRVELVPAAYSSQTCAQCQNVDKASRQGERYNCTKCGNQAHADVNAAKVLVQRYNSRRSDGEAVRGGYGEASRPAKRKMRVVRRVNKTYVGIS